MGVYCDAPQWFSSSFVRAAKCAGATASDDHIEDVADKLVERWNAPERHFHNLKHLAAVLHRVDELAQETHEPDLVRLAAWYHGAIFTADSRMTKQARGGEQTHASAQAARIELTALGVPADRADRVAQLVDSLLLHAPGTKDVDAAVLNDADLAMLATEPQRYRQYVAAIRTEYAHIPLLDFVRARQRIVGRLLARERLFSSPTGAIWEEPARQNLQAESARLAKELRKLEAAQAAEAETVARCATAAMPVVRSVD